MRQLIDAHDEFMRRRTLFAEIRLTADAGSIAEPIESSGYQHIDFLNFVVDLSQSEEQLWQNIGKSTRGKIRRSERRGVEIEFAANEETIARVYRLVRTSYQRSRVPLADISLFRNALRLLPPGVVQIRIATHQGRDVAGTIGLCDRSRYFAWYGGTTRPTGIDPFATIVWDEIQWSHQHGLRFYDFGGAGCPHQDYGPRVFKSRFHGQLMNHGRYRKVYSAKRLALAERGFQSLNAFFGSGSGERT